MHIFTLLILLLWLACGVLVFRFVKRTGGFSEVGRIAHWFGGAFVMFGLAIGMILLGSLADASFGTRVNYYVLSHQIRPGDQRLIILVQPADLRVTVIRRGQINFNADIIAGQPVIDDQSSVKTSWWWMLWGKL